MSQRFVCGQGHEWEADEIPLTSNMTNPPCPHCGEPSHSNAGSAQAPVEASTLDMHGLSSTRSFQSAARPATSKVTLPVVDDYEILGVLGRGGMGVVYKARQLSLKRLVALKMILAGEHSSAEHLARFHAEAEAVARFQQPNIVCIHQIGEQNGRPYLSLEFVDGGNLGAKLAGRPQSGRDAAQMVETLARAMHYAHQHDIIHRDLKPGNILLTSDGVPKITDFGLAKHLDDDTGHTRSGEVMGTPSYMAPEQARGDLKQISPLTDVYALGAILYEMLTGRPPFRGATSIETLQQIVSQEVTPPSGLQPKIHRDVETICLKALAKESSHRYASALELAEDLARFLAGDAILARREGVVRRLVRRVRRYPVLAASMFALVMAVLVAGTIAWKYRDARRIATVGRAVETGLSAVELSADYLVRMDAQIDELSELSPEESLGARQRLNQRLVEMIGDEIRRPVLAAEDVAHINSAINLLTNRVPDQAAGLRRSLGQRLRDWETVFDLQPPYPALATVFDKNMVRADGQSLRRLTEMGDKGAVVFSQAECRGNVDVLAVFDASWSDASRIGVVLNAGPARGYTYLIRVPDEVSATDGVPPRSFAEVRSAGGVFSLQILRGQVKLQEKSVLAASFPEGPLRIAAKRTGDVLDLTVNTRYSVDAQDLFPLATTDSGVVALDWPDNVGLQSLQVHRQALPIEASPLEQGDELYGLGRYDEAINFYRQQAIASIRAEVAQQARYKVGLCLLSLNQLDDAAAEFERVTAEDTNTAGGSSENRWPINAGCQLWLLRLGQQRLDDADAVFESLSSRYAFAQLAAVVPDETRSAIIKVYLSASEGVNVANFNPNRVKYLERSVDVERYLHVPEIEHVHAKRSLLRAYCLVGQTDQAVEAAEAFLREEELDTSSNGDNLVEEYGWLMRDVGQAERGLTEVDRRLLDKKGMVRPERVALLVERARLHVAMSRLDEAERDLDRYFQLTSADEASFHYWSSAVLMRGFLLAWRGDEDGALAAWKQGRTTKSPSRYSGPRSLSGSGGVEFMHDAMLGSLAGDMTDEEAGLLTAKLLASQTSQSTVGLLASVYRLPPSIVRNGWKTPRGRECAEKIAFRSISFSEYVKLPLVVLGMQILREGAMPADESVEQEDVFWTAATEFVSAYRQGQVKQPQVLQLALGWKGTTGLLGWAGIAPSMDPKFRGPVAYVFGQRYVRLNRPQDAIAFFRTARDDAPGDSPLRVLAENELQRLGMP